MSMSSVQACTTQCTCMHVMHTHTGNLGASRHVENKHTETHRNTYIHTHMAEGFVRAQHAFMSSARTHTHTHTHKHTHVP